LCAFSIHISSESLVGYFLKLDLQYFEVQFYMPQKRLKIQNG
jgi:hypothetical protein